MTHPIGYTLNSADVSLLLKLFSSDLVKVYQSRSKVQANRIIDKRQRGQSLLLEIADSAPPPLPEEISIMVCRPMHYRATVHISIMVLSIFCTYAL